MAGFELEKINFLTPENLQLHPDVVLISSDGQFFKTSRLLLSSVSALFLKLFLDFESHPANSGDDMLIVITEFPSHHVETLVTFVTSGNVPMSPECILDPELVNCFLDCGIDLSLFHLIPMFDQTVEDESFANILPVETELLNVIKTEEICDEDDDLTESPDLAASNEVIESHQPTRKSSRRKTRNLRYVSGSEFDDDIDDDKKKFKKTDDNSDPEFIVKGSGNSKRKVEVDDDEKPIGKRRKKAKFKSRFAKATTTLSPEASSPSPEVPMEENSNEATASSSGNRRRKHHKCPHCPKVIGDYRHYRRHLLAHKTLKRVEDLWFCLHCDDDDVYFSTYEELDKHKNELHRGKLLTCPKCGRTYKGTSARLFRKHVASHDLSIASKKNVCVSCGLQTHDRASLHKHMKSQGPFHDGKCPICDVEFENRADYERHVYKEHDGSFHYRCGVCPQVFETIERRRIHRHNDHKGMTKKAELQVCEFCGDLVRCMYYANHVANHHSNAEIPCPKCNKVFGHQDVLNRHLKNYHNEFPCEHCGKTMRNKKRYNLHVLSSHTPDHLKPFICNICQPVKGFHAKINYTEHMNIHTGDRPHKCKFCGVGFNSMANKFHHERSHQGIRRKKQVRR